MKWTGLIAWALLVLACGERSGPPPARVVGKTEERKDTTLLRTNRDIARLEALDIEAWADRRGGGLVPTGTGVLYRMLRDVPGATAKPGRYATVNYVLQLLNGDTVYTSPKGKPESFLVEEDQVESGLHEAIQFLSPGDSAVIVIPSHRAHGLLGDQEGIPPRSTVVYFIGLAAVR